MTHSLAVLDQINNLKNALSSYQRNNEDELTQKETKCNRKPKK